MYLKVNVNNMPAFYEKFCQRPMLQKSIKEVYRPLHPNVLDTWFL